ncbi:hypothetical protein BDR22DRAFT_964878 [Usnea florida]
MQPHRHPDRRPGRPPYASYAPPDEEFSSGFPNAHARPTIAEHHTANPYDHESRVPSGAMPGTEHERWRERYEQYTADLLEMQRQRRGAISLGSSGEPPSAFPTPGVSAITPAGIMEAERNRVREQRRAAISSGSLVMPPPPLPSYQYPEVATANPTAVSGAAESSISGRNRLRSESNPWGPPPPPRQSSRLPSFDGASSQGMANLDNDDDRPRTFQEAMERNRSRNSEPYGRVSGRYGSPRLSSPPPAQPSALSNERPSRGMANPTHGSFSAAIQEAVDYDRDLAARSTDSQRRHDPQLPTLERAPAVSARDRQLDAMNRAVQPRNRARNGDVSRVHLDPNFAPLIYDNTRRRALTTARYELLGYDFHAVESGEQRASYLQLSKEKIESFVEALPVHVMLDLPAKEQDCAICMEKYYGPHQQECPVRLPCNHVLGKACLLTWLKSPPSNRNNNCCPVCRTVLLQRVPIFPAMDDFPDDPSSGYDISDHFEEGSVGQWNALIDDNPTRRNQARERIARQRSELERTTTGPEGQHETWFRESEETHQVALARIRSEHAARMESLEGMRGDRRRRRTGS